MEEKFILDATAGYRMMHFNKKHPNVLYLDQRPECEPDVVGDFTDLSQFPNNTFQLVIFDPPHFVKNHHGLAPDTGIARRFGALNVETCPKCHTQYRIVYTDGTEVCTYCGYKIVPNKNSAGVKK